MIVRFERMARAEFDDAVDFSNERFGQGVELTDAVRRAVRKIVKDPGRFQEWAPDTHVFRMQRFPCYLVYQIDREATEIVIWAFAHTSREPGYWHTRLPE